MRAPPKKGPDANPSHNQCLPRLCDGHPAQRVPGAGAWIPGASATVPPPRAPRHAPAADAAAPLPPRSARPIPAASSAPLSSATRVVGSTTNKWSVPALVWTRTRQRAGGSGGMFFLFGAAPPPLLCKSLFRRLGWRKRRESERGGGGLTQTHTRSSSSCALPQRASLSVSRDTHTHASLSHVPPRHHHHCRGEYRKKQSTCIRAAAGRWRARSPARARVPFFIIIKAREGETHARNKQMVLSLSPPPSHRRPAHPLPPLPRI